MTTLDEIARAFPPADAARWRTLAEKALKGAPLSGLVSRTADDIAIEPLYPAAPAAMAELPGPAPIGVLQRLDHADADTALAQAPIDRAGGAGGFALVLAGSASAYGGGLAPAALARLLADPAFAAAAVRLDRGDVATAEALLGVPDTAVDLAGSDLGLDATVLDAAAAAGLVNRAMGSGFGGRLFLADGRPVHHAGGSEAQELGHVLASGVAALRQMEAAGLPLEAARERLSFLLVADADLLLTLAKFRALRLLWRQVEAASGLDPAPIRLHAETAWRMLTRLDPATNILRNTLAAFAAMAGGADRLAVLPHTLALGSPDAGARRIARNIPLILDAEAGLRRVADPAAGSGAVEALTAAVAEAGWAEFQRIEREGWLDRRVTRTRSERLAALERGETAIVGTTRWRPDGTSPVYAAPFMNEADFPPLRLAEPFEGDAP